MQVDIVFKFKHQRDKHSKKEYRRLNNELRGVTDKARKKWWEEQQCDQIEDLPRAAPRFCE